MEHRPARKHAELVYQAARARELGHVGATPAYIIERYRRCRLWRFFPKELLFKCLRDHGMEEKEILDFGCGEGEISTQLAKLGGRVTAIDISPELIEMAKRRSDLDGVRDRVACMVRDIEESPLPESQFDFAVCNAVLHHVDVYAYLPRILTSLKPGGVAIIVEPIAFSRFLQRLRDLLPIEKNASPGERQLNSDELTFIAGMFADRRVIFFNLFGRLDRLLRYRNKIDKGHPLTKACVVVLHACDRLLLTVFPSLARLCGTAVIIGQKAASREPQADVPPQRVGAQAIV